MTIEDLVKRINALERRGQQPAISAHNQVTREELEVIRQHMKTVENGTDQKLATSNQQVKRVLDE
jgi:hypothetical protein